MRKTEFLKETDQKAINERLLAIVTEINSFNAEKENPLNIIFYKGA